MVGVNLVRSRVFGRPAFMFLPCRSFTGLLLLAGSLAVAQQPSAELRIQVTSGGKPAAARLYILDEGNRPQLIPGAVTYSKNGEAHSVVDQKATLTLPPGKYRVRAEKGMEYRKSETTVSLEAGQTVEISLEVARLLNMNEQGWYSGDLHIHRSPQDMPVLLRAEDLNIGPTITRHVGSGREVSPFPETPLLPADATHTASAQNQEVERLVKGHGAIVLLNLPQPIDPNMTALYPMDAEFCRQARAAGAFLDAEKPIWKNVPVNAALGLVDAIGVVNNHFHPHGLLLDAEKYGSMERDRPAYKTPAGFAQWMLDLYYSLLNCGFRIPVSAGSASGVMPSWPGYERVYVHLSGPFSYEQWFRDLKAGRSFATNGPLLEVYMDGQAPGASVNWDGPTGATVAIEAHAQERVDRVEILYNGEVIRSFPSGGSNVFHTALNLTITEPGWLAVRCFEPVGETVRYAQTSPFYFLRAGKLPARRQDALRWAEYIRRMAASLTAADYASPEAYQAAQSTFKEAEAVYRRLAAP